MFAPNLAWRDEPLRAELERLIDLPVVVENDANAAAWGEFAFGAGADAEDLLLVTVGTGVGGGIVLDGSSPRRVRVAAEIGHMRVVPDGRPCGCGNRAAGSSTPVAPPSSASPRAGPRPTRRAVPRRPAGGVEASPGR